MENKQKYVERKNSRNSAGGSNSAVVENLKDSKNSRGLTVKSNYAVLGNPKDLKNSGQRESLEKLALKNEERKHIALKRDEELQKNEYTRDLKKVFIHKIFMEDVDDLKQLFKKDESLQLSIIYSIANEVVFNKNLFFYFLDEFTDVTKLKYLLWIYSKKVITS